MIRRVRNLAVACAKAYVTSRERLGFPLLGGGAAAGAEAAPAPAAAGGEASDGAR
jgi:hypothetical protein